MQNMRTSDACLLVCGVVFAASVQAAPRELVLGPGSTLMVRCYGDGPAARLTNDHVIETVDVVGHASYDADMPTALTVAVTAHTASMRVDDPAARQQHGLSDPVSDKDRRSIDAAMKGPDTLHVKRYPTVSFRSSSAKRDAQGLLTVTGELTLHGRTRTVKVPVTLSPQPDGKVRGQGQFRIKTSEFGITPYSAFLGAIKVKDEVDIFVMFNGVDKP
jgi:polyisoprenoid-binding protein YceI